MSKLIKKLRQVSENTAPPMGFKTTAVTPGRSMLLIAALSQGNAGEAPQLVEAGIDAVLVHSQNKELQSLKKIAGSMGDIPWGVWLEAITGEGVEKIKGMGGDFLVLVASEAPASLLQEELGKVIKITLPCEEGLIRTVNQLQIDAVLLDLIGKDKNLTVSQIMNCQWLTGSISKPLLVVIKQELKDKEIQSLREAGVIGIVLEVGEKSQPEIMKLRQAIEALPPIQRKPKERRAALLRPESEVG